MRKRTTLFLIISTLCSIAFCQDNIQELIRKRDSAYTIYQKESPSNSDTTSSKSTKRVKSMMDLIEKDNLIIDIVNDKVGAFVKDTTITNKLNTEISKQNKELDQKSSMLMIFMISVVVSSGLFVLFLILFFSSKLSLKKLKKDFEASSLLILAIKSENDDLKIKLNKSQNNLKEENEKLKIASENEKIRNKEIHTALLKEIDRIKDVSKAEKNELIVKLNTTNLLQSTNTASNDELERIKSELQVKTQYIHHAKEENSRLVLENNELKDTLKTLSTVPVELIEEMEFNLMKIERLTQLLVEGKISEEEFDEKRKMLLDEF